MAFRLSHPKSPILDQYQSESGSKPVPEMNHPN